MEYIVVIQRRKEKFIAEVQARLNEGWELQGGVCIDGFGLGVRRYVQALVKKSK